MDTRQAPNSIDVNGPVSGASTNDLTRFTGDNRKAWDAIAHDWELNQSPEVNGQAEDGNDMFTQCLLPVLDELVHWTEGETVLDLGAGSGIIARRFARKGANVTGLDFSQRMMDKGRERYEKEKDQFPGTIEYGFIDLMDVEGMVAYMQKRKDALGEAEDQ